MTQPSTTEIPGTLTSSRKKAYSDQKDCGIISVEDIPRHWDEVKLWQVADVESSNVDKKSRENEQDIFLCNYTDVYYQGEIDPDTDFMEATASEEEIQTFRLEEGDVIITKDSEDQNDIAVPAYVPSDFSDVVCGYHLAHIKADPDQIVGKYLYYTLKSEEIADQFSVRANGVTRFGLGLRDIKSGKVLLPTLEEQKAIVHFLDQETEKIDQLIEQKERLIELLEEKREALITRAVTKGLNPDAEMKDSEVEWLGEIPDDWNVTKLKYLSRKLIDSEHKTPPYKDKGDYFVVRTSNIDDGEIDYSDAKYTDEDIYRQWTQRGKPEDGDLLLTREAPAGEAVVLDKKADQICLGQRIVLIKEDSDKLLNQFLCYFIYSRNLQNYVTSKEQGSTVAHFNVSDIINLDLVQPNLDEQRQIIEYLEKETGKIDEFISKIKKSMNFLSEYRKVLVSSAVTGKIDVREEVNAY